MVDRPRAVEGPYTQAVMKASFMEHGLTHDPTGACPGRGLSVVDRLGSVQFQGCLWLDILNSRGDPCVILKFGFACWLELLLRMYTVQYTPPASLHNRLHSPKWAYDDDHRERHD